MLACQILVVPSIVLPCHSVAHCWFKIIVLISHEVHVCMHAALINVTFGTGEQ